MDYNEPAMPFRISVAMATYNGAKYIAEQLSSILSQLSPDDELVIVDDCSKDDTPQIIESFADTRIRLRISPRNNGVAKSFTEAIASCNGDIIFLADQDDIWLPGKVQTILQIFANNPTVNIVSTDAIVIDHDGKQISSSYYADRGGFTNSAWRNLVKSRFHGCLMAFRSELRPLVLPLALYHDVWIGLCNAISGGQAVLIPQPFVAYRRHGKNESSPLKWNQQIAKRVGLFGQVVRRLPHLRKKK